MPPPVARDYFVILFDANTSSKAEALSTLFKVCLLKQLGTKDNAKVFFLNVNETNNDKNFEGICQLETSCFKAEVVLNYLEKLGKGESNWLEALEVAIDNLAKCYQSPGVISLQLLFITDFANTRSCLNSRLTEAIISKLNNYDIFLYIVGVPVKPSKILMHEEDIANWKKNLCINEKNENLVEAKNIIQKTKNSVMADYYTGFHLFFAYKYCKGMQPWPVPLTFFNKFELPVSTVRVLKHEPPFKPEVARKVIESIKWVTPDQKDYDPSEIMSGIIKQNKFVKIDTDDMFKIEGERSFMVLGFTDSGNVPEYLMQSEATYMVMPDPKQEFSPALEVLFLLIDQLAAQEKYAIVRRVYNRNNIPKFMVLIPRPDKTPKCFLMVELPYADDIDQGYTEEDVNKAPKVGKDEQVYLFLDSINLNKETNVRNVSLAPTLMYEQVCVDLAYKVEKDTCVNIKEWGPQKLEPDCLKTEEKNKRLDDLLSKWSTTKTFEANNDDEDSSYFNDLTYSYDVGSDWD